MNTGEAKPPGKERQEEPRPGRPTQCVSQVSRSPGPGRPEPILRTVVPYSNHVGLTSTAHEVRKATLASRGSHVVAAAARSSTVDTGPPEDPRSVHLTPSPGAPCMCCRVPKSCCSRSLAQTQDSVSFAPFRPSEQGAGVAREPSSRPPVPAARSPHGVRLPTRREGAPGHGPPAPRRWAPAQPGGRSGGGALARAATGLRGSERARPRGCPVAPPPRAAGPRRGAEGRGAGRAPASGRAARSSPRGVLHLRSLARRDGRELGHLRGLPWACAGRGPWPLRPSVPAAGGASPESARRVLGAAAREAPPPPAGGPGGPEGAAGRSRRGPVARSRVGAGMASGAAEPGAGPRGYRYGPRELRRREFGRLAGTVYLDHAGATLFPQSQLTSFTKDLMENVYGNPHSQNITSRLTHDTVEQMRYRILAHFNTTADDYSVVFTSGSTAALKLVAEAFPWVSQDPEGSGSQFCYLTDNHTSVVGMRKVAAAVNVTSTPVSPEDMWLAEERSAVPCDPSCHFPHLFCYPAQSNFSGTKYPLSWIEEIKSGRLRPVNVPGMWFVLLDAASYVSTSPLDLSAHQADFIPISFYKMFGFPTGLGALLVSNHVAPLLRKSYFGGGTAAAYLAGEDFYIPRPSVAERFEDGTISFLDVIALKHGFDALKHLTGGMENIKQHTFTLAQYTYAALSSLHYPNGAPVVRIYSDSEFSSPDVQGPIINFNVLDDNGDIIGYSQVDKMACLYNICLRTGCFCNTGACQRHLGISNEMVKKHLQAGHVCGDDVDLIDGQPTGSVRISFGYMSTLEDAQAFLQFIIDTRLHLAGGQPVPQVGAEEAGPLSAEDKSQGTTPTVTDRHCFSPPESACIDCGVCSDSHLLNTVGLHPSLSEANRSQQTPDKAAGSLPADPGPHVITNLYLYPIKSCAAFEVTEWPIGKQGLLYDRSWMVVNHNGICLSQKQEPRLCLIQPFIDLQQKILVIKAKGMEPVEVPLEEDSEQIQICQSKVCTDRVNTYDCGEKVSIWLSKFFGRPCHLIRQSSDFQRNAKKKRGKDQSPGVTATLSLVNEAQYLLINTSSILELHQQLNTSDENGKKELFPMKDLISRFRANIIMNGTRAFEEEKWDEISIGSLHFQVQGPCHRCQMICIDQKSGQRNQDVFQKLSETRKRKVNFGVYLMHTSLDLSSPCFLSVGSQVLPVLKDKEHHDLPALEKHQDVVL
ncbi:molybdenum cofactor sulfurase [Ctenodactylus gundi]